MLDNATTARILKFFGINLTGIELQATGMDWKFESGTRVARPAEDVLLVLCGRQADARGLAGERGRAASRAAGTVAMRVAQDQLAATFGALADPTRRAILVRLAAGDATVNELAGPFEPSLPAISKHLKVLERCGLI